NVSLHAAADGGLLDLNLTPQVTGSASISLPVKLAAQVAGVTLPASTAVAVSMPDVTNPNSLSVTLTPAPQLAGILSNLEAVAVGQVLAGVQRLVGFLRAVQSRGVFQQKLPVLNRSLADVLDLAEKLDALSRELQTNPPTTIGEALARINQLLGSAAQVSLQNKVLQLGLSYNFDKTVQLPLSFNLDDRLKAAILKDLFNLDASAPLTLSIGGRVSLGLAIDLTTPTAPVFSIADSSKVSFTTLLNASNINLEAGVGPLGITVAGGHVFLDSGTP